MAGLAAAQAVIKASETADFSAQSLSIYETILEESFVLKDFKEFREVPEAMNHKRLFTYYPQLIGNVFSSLYHMPNGPKDRAIPTAKKFINFKVIKDILLKDAKKVTKL